MPEEPKASDRHETETERLDRKWNDLLQELRVMQTGAQLTAGFLLTLPFQDKFDDLDDFQRTLYLVLVVLAALTTAVVVAPVAVHRRLSGLHVKERVVTIAHRLVGAGLVLLGLLVTGMSFLIFDVVVDRTVAAVVSAAVALVLLGPPGRCFPERVSSTTNDVRRVRKPDASHAACSVAWGSAPTPPRPPRDGGPPVPGAVPLVDGQGPVADPARRDVLRHRLDGAQAVMPAVHRPGDRPRRGREGQRRAAAGPAVMLLIGLVQAVSGIMRHRFAVTNWLVAAYRTVQLVGRQSVHLGGALPRKVSTGEVVAIGTSDLSHLGQLMDVTARFAGAIVSFLLVSVILLQTSVTLGLVVLIGVPAPDAADRAAAPAAAAAQRPPAAPDGRPVQHRHRHRRRACGCCAASAASRSSTTATAASRRRPGGPASRWPGCSRCSTPCRCFLPGVFVVLVVWLGARSAVARHDHPR